MVQIFVEDIEVIFGVMIHVLLKSYFQVVCTTTNYIQYSSTAYKYKKKLK